MADVNAQNDGEQFLKEERAMWAANALIEQIRGTVNGLIASATAVGRREMYENIRTRLAACEVALLNCADLLPRDPKTGQTQCAEYYHLEDGKCVPDWPVPNPGRG